MICILVANRFLKDGFLPVFLNINYFKKPKYNLKTFRVSYLTWKVALLFPMTSLHCCSHCQVCHRWLFHLFRIYSFASTVLWPVDVVRASKPQSLQQEKLNHDVLTILCRCFFFSSSELIISCTLTNRFWLLTIFCSSLSLSSTWRAADFRCSFVAFGIFKCALSSGSKCNTTDEKNWWFSRDSIVGSPDLQASDDKIESRTDSAIVSC